MAGSAITCGEEVVLLFAAIRLLLRAMFRASRSDASLGGKGCKTRMLGSDDVLGCRWGSFPTDWIIGNRSPRIPCASRETDNVHRRPDEHRGRWDQHRLVVHPSHRLPSCEVALVKRFVIPLRRVAAKKINAQVR